MSPDRVREWLKRIGKSQADLADALQLTPDKISKVFGGKRRFTADEAVRIQAMMDEGDLVDAPSGDLVYVRQVDISYSMGDGAIIEDYPSAGLMPFNANFIRSITNSSIEHLFIATGHGDSMEPTLLRSDLLMIDASQNRIAQQDQIWALSYAGCGMIKRVRRQRGQDGDELVILSDNPIVPAQVVSLDDVFVVGRLVWVGRRM